MIFTKYKNTGKCKSILLFKYILILVLLIINPKIYSQPNTINIKIYFDAPPSTYNVSKAVLKYDKDFAYSFTLDDGKADAYSVVYPFYKGGNISYNSNTYPGLFYTDGCGNTIPFKAGISITSVNPSGNDTHTDNPNNITWDQAKEMFEAGWYVYNHSYSHSIGAGTNYDFEISQNNQYVKTKTGIDLTHFVVPSGDTNYIPYAFSRGMKAVYDQKGFPGGEGFKVDGIINFDKFGLYRRFLDDDNFNTSNITPMIDEVAAKSIGGNHYWFNEFTHQVGQTYTPGGITFSTFEYYMNYIQSNYGQKGSDRIWMAPLQEVYEYLVVRDKVIVSQNLNGNVLEISLDFSNAPADLRKYAVTLLIDSDQNFSTIDETGTSASSFNGAAQKKLINLEWNTFPGQTISAIADPISTRVNCFQQPIGIYPNPVQDRIQLSLDYDGKILLNLYDQSGKKYSLGYDGFTTGIVDLNIQHLKLAPGIYFLEVISEKEKCKTFVQLIKY